MPARKQSNRRKRLSEYRGIPGCYRPEPQKENRLMKKPSLFAGPSTGKKRWFSSNDCLLKEMIISLLNQPLPLCCLLQQMQQSQLQI